MLFKLPSIAVALITVTLLPLPLRAQPDAEKVLYRKPLSDGRELVVVQEPVVPASALKDLIASPAFDKMLGYTCLDVMLRSPSNPPLRLWCRRYPLYPGREREEFQVLDLGVKRDLIVLAMAGPGSDIFLARIGFAGWSAPDAIAGLPGADWSLLGAAIPTKPGRLSAKIAFDESETQVSVEVTDFLQDTKQHTSFSQTKGEWKFVRVKQWQEKVPATQPASGGDSK